MQSCSTSRAILGPRLARITRMCGRLPHLRVSTYEIAGVSRCRCSLPGVKVPLPIPDNQGHHGIMLIPTRRSRGCRDIRPQNNNRPSIQHKCHGQLGGACPRASDLGHQPTNMRNGRSCSSSKAEPRSYGGFGWARSPVLAAELAHGRIPNRSQLLRLEP